MTKQKKTEQIPELREFVWLPMSGKAPVPLGKVIHVTREMMAKAWEQARRPEKGRCRSGQAV
jgi:hypothetical protein